MRLTYKQASTIIAQTEEMKDELCKLGLNPEKIVVLHNLIDESLINRKACESSPFPKDSKIRFVSVGRFAPQKGFDILVKAFKIVNDRIPDTELYIVGSFDGEGKVVFDELCRIISTLEIDGKVYFTGYTDNPYKYIKNSSVYVLSSRYEGLPNVLVEAQFLGIPSAAVNCIPMIARMIKDGENGFLAEPENPESLANAMISACSMKKIKQIYKPSSRKDFINIFQS